MKPLGSEKLQADDKLKRILELTYYKDQPHNNTSTPNRTVEFISESVNGVFGIVREKDGYYVKKGLTEGSLDYIGGMFMKNKNRFKSYAEALKRLDLLNGGVINEATKYVLKQKTAAPEVEPEIESEPEMGADETGMDSPLSDSGSEDLGMDELPGEEEGKPSDYMSEVQKYSGKLGQEIRDQKSKMESDDIKYVLNMIISAVDLDKLDDEDIEDIGSRFDRDVEDVEDDFGGEDDFESEEYDDTEEDDLGEIDSMDELGKFADSESESEQVEDIDLKKYSDIGEEEVDLSVEIDLDAIKDDISNSIGDTLSKYFEK